MDPAAACVVALSSINYGSPIACSTQSVRGIFDFDFLIFDVQEKKSSGIYPIESVGD